MRMPRTVAGRSEVSVPAASRMSRATGAPLRLARALPGLARRHWLLALLLAAGLVLRVLVQIAYRPALMYIDSIKYLYGAYPGNDPPGYQLLLKPFLAVANLDLVAVVQHVLGLAIAVALYALLRRRGVWRWLAALAVAPVLLDGYQLQMEQTVMPDVLFEALMVAGIVVLLWRTRPGLWEIGIAGFLLGIAPTVWQPGEILLLPAVVYALVMVKGSKAWRRRLLQAAVLCVAFAVPVVAVSFRNYLALKHFALAPDAAATIYGRTAYAADCQTLKLPSYEKSLCPPRQLALQLGPDNLDHSLDSPLKHFTPPAGMTRHGVATDFSTRVFEQQPLRVIGSVLSDATKLFAVHRGTSPGDTPISRWQFQTSYPQYPPYVTVQGGHIQYAYRDYLGTPVSLGSDQDFGGGGPRVITPLARFLRSYQLNGGYTPGPLLLGLLVAALLGSAFLLRPRKRAGPGERATATACFYLLATTVLLLLLSDAFEFSWRYQLNAIVTLPSAGALGLTVVIGYVTGRVRGRHLAAPKPVTAGGSPDGAASDPGADGPEVADGPGVADGPAGSAAAGRVNQAGQADLPDRVDRAGADSPVADGLDGPPPPLSGNGSAGESPEAGASADAREPQGKNRASAG